MHKNIPLAYFKKFLLILSLFIFKTSTLLNAQTQMAGRPHNAVINVDLTKTSGDMKPIWSAFGYDEPNYTYMKDGKKLLSELAALSPVPVYVRTHNLLTTGGGVAALKWGSTNAYTEDANGNPVYNWKIIDSIFDTYISRGMKPIAEIGFMPEALSIKPTPYKHNWDPGNAYSKIFTGWAHPPNDYKKWAELVFQWVKHSVQRYGKTEVESWYWELWNEPNIGYWQGTREEYFKLYDYSADAVKRALPSAKIGGPHSTGPADSSGYKFLDAFLKHIVSGKNYATGKTGSPLDYIGFHAKGAPRVVDGHVRMNIGKQLRDIYNGFKIVSSYPSLKHLPIIIGESDPEGCAACGMKTNPENAYRNGTMYSSYTAASFARKYALADSLEVNLKAAVSWSFEFENQPWFAGFRDLATNGIDKPVLNVFRMFGMMQGKKAFVSSTSGYSLKRFIDSSVRRSSDINGIASKASNKAAVMVWNYHDDDMADSAATVEINIKGLPAGRLQLFHYRIDSEYSNSYEVWKKMSSPQNPTKEQIEVLEKAGQLQLYTSPEWLTSKGPSMTLKIILPRQAVSLLKFVW
jgi:xylan 1,4-beta-xylosidase